MSPDAQKLLDHAEFLRRVVRSLVRSDADADDVVQSTWVAALRHGTPPGRARAWLATVARNLVRRRHRDAGRRAHREAVAARSEATPSTARTAAQLSVHRALVEAIEGLAEPYRTTVLLRFFHEQPPREIARSCGVPAATVRTRLHRALAMLRARLQAHDTRWKAIVAPWLVGATSSLAPVAVVFAVIAVAGATYLAVRPSRAPRRSEVQASAAPPPVAQRESQDTRPATPAPEAVRTEKPTPDPFARYAGTSPSRSVAGTVLEDREPAASGEIFLRAYDVWRELPVNWMEKPDRRGSLDAHGRFAFHDLKRGWHVVGVRRRGIVREAVAFVDEEEPTKRLLFVLGRAEIRGRVLDELGRPLGDRLVCLSNTKEAHAGHRFLGWARTHADGSFASPGWPAGGYWVAPAPSADRPRDPGFTRQVTVPAGARSASVDFGHARPLPRWSGTVRTHTGAAVRGPGRIQIMPRGTPDYSYVAIDAEGRFSAAVPPGRYRAVVHLPGVRFTPVADVDVPETDVTIDVELSGRTVTGRAPGARQVRLEPIGFEDRWRFVGADVVDGAFRFEGVPPGRYRFAIDPKPDARATGVVAIEVGDRDVDAGSIRG